MKSIWLILLSGLLPLGLFAQINPENISIARDQWGVPHIFAKSDPEVAYGFGWATCEDDFLTVQQQLLPIKGLMGLVYGKDGAILDVAVKMLGAHEIVEEKYETDLAPDFRKYLEAYCQGVNAYARNHPEEVLHKKLFPAEGKDIITTYVVGMAMNSGVVKELEAILKGKIKPLAENQGMGSNAFAISRKRTTDGKTYLAINSHQPLEGPNSWYEAHLCSEEGLNILGGAFAGGPVIHHGVNPNLGWAHTFNYPDLADVYQLTMHPEEENLYRFDGEWLKLKKCSAKGRVRLFNLIRVGKKQEFFESIYGLTLKTEQGVFALRFPANRDIRAAEQWYRMDKATNLEEFKAALSIRGIISVNLVYADREDHLMYMSFARAPVRNPDFNWKQTLPGDTSATLWTDKYYPIDSLPHVIDPESGFVYNCNHSPFLSTAEADNPPLSSVPSTIGFQGPEVLTNRAVRLKYLIDQQDHISYEDFKRIKYDRAYHTPLESAPKLEPVFHLNPVTYPGIAETINLLKSWDRETRPESEAASAFILILRHVQKKITYSSSYREGDEINEALLVEAIKKADEYLLQHFGKKSVPLSELQRHVRGDMNLPVSGGPDVLAALSASPQPDGRLYSRAGDSYISLVRFSDEGVEIETVNAYGASTKADSPHFTDQMEMYANRQLKKMTLDKEEVLTHAVRIYHPGQ